MSKCRKIFRTYDLHPDGVLVNVNWDKMAVSTSIFIPCLNTEEAVNQISSIFAWKGWEFTHTVRIENGKLGLRVWRTV